MIHRASGSSPYLSLKPICSSLSLNFLCSPSCLSWPLLYFQHRSAFFFFFSRWNFAFLLSGELYPQSVSSVTQSCMTLCNPWTAAHQASLSITNSQSLFKFMSIESVMPSNNLLLHHLSAFPPALNFSQHQGLFQ